MSNDRVLIAGAGPVGLVAAAHLARAGVPVTVFEEGADLSTESRASTFHPPTLDMLDALGAAAPLIAQGLKAPTFQYRTKKHGLLAEFDFAAITDATKHPYRVQSEQSKLTRILFEQMRGHPNFEMKFNSRVTGVSQDGAGVEVTLEGGSSQRGRYLIGADGASSTVRRSLGIEFEGFTWPDRLLVISTPFDFFSVIPGLSSVSYVADPQRWYFLLQIPGLWRAMFLVNEEASDERVQTEEFAQSLMAGVVPGITNYEISHTTLYKVHQRVAKTFRLGRAVLIGDAAHINNPLGGMGMNGGIHDAVNLAEKLVMVWHGRAPESELERFDKQRRLVTLEYIQNYTIQNKKNLESTGDEFGQSLRAIAADPARTRDYLLRVSMITSLARAQELG
ncbi:FAD-dependent oxidoreductase [Rhodoplanes sp. Z2-YC6860]|uniref:FAD-dependent oxidoreductase n=1 Tax=Rhodoplanes sp. Z2-YC6860 TaxID=674703 RepID=UPI00078C8659|nr:FAD-dependent monooxygenase [Rhodoplanes sp. Z2-YC6860]AMN43071.1 2-polyprenyl-6-methoxyphenol hydroxylase-like oxidoreductase [Rhodoplanes sp. Z2-YC6860]